MEGEAGKEVGWVARSLSMDGVGRDGYVEIWKDEQCVVYVTHSPDVGRGRRGRRKIA